MSLKIWLVRSPIVPELRSGEYFGAILVRSEAFMQNLEVEN